MFQLTKGLQKAIHAFNISVMYKMMWMDMVCSCVEKREFHTESRLVIFSSDLTASKKPDGKKAGIDVLSLLRDLAMCTAYLCKHTKTSHTRTHICKHTHIHTHAHIHT